MHFLVQLSVVPLIGSLVPLVAASNIQGKRSPVRSIRMKDEAIKIQQAHVIGQDTIQVCFSDETAALFSLAELLACNPVRFPSGEEVALDQLKSLAPQRHA